MDRTPLDSRAVVSAGYDDASQTLEVEFTSGRIYQFDRVPRAAYEWLLRTPSKGAYVSRMINGRYAYRDVTHASAKQAAPEAAEELEASLRASLSSLRERGEHGER